MPRISQIAAGAFAAALAFTSVASFAAGSSDPETDQVKSRVVERLGVRPTTVAKTPFGLWEISVAPDQVFLRRWECPLSASRERGRYRDT